MRVYRVEGPDGKGPYNGEHVDYDDERFEFHGRMMNAHNFIDPCNHPSALADYALRNCCLSRNELFGFTSMQDLYRWFGGYVKLMLNVDYKIRTYDVPEYAVVKGSRQCVFDVRESTIIR